MAANFEIPVREIKVGQGSFTVRGMNSEDLVFLTSGYLEDVKGIVAKHGEKRHGGLIPREQVADLLMDIAKGFPMMTAEIISRCAEAEDQIDKFRQLSFMKQLEALKAIADLTAEDGGIELKKWGEVLASLLEASGLQLGPLTKSLQTIIETSANR